MKKLIGFIVIMAFVMATASMAFARGAPTKEKVFTHQAIVVDVVAPNVALRSVPPRTVGYDVICNLSKTDVIANFDTKTNTTGKVRQSATGAWRSTNANQPAHTSRAAPDIALLA